MTDRTASAPGEFRLQAVAFLCGAGLMALEMAGVRILEPHFGTTIYVWGSIIGIFLGALSLGYWAGGRIADRSPQLSTLGMILFVAAALVFLVPWISIPLCQWLNGTGGAGAAAIEDSRLRSVVASLILYAIPSALLGTVSPFAVRLAARDVAGLGHVAGTLYAISTVGSIVGTFLASFVLVEFVGSRNVIFGVGVLLVGVAFLCLAGRSAVRPALSAGLMLVFGGFGLWQARASEAAGALHFPALQSGRAAHGGAPDRLLETLESAYHHIAVLESGYNYAEGERLAEGQVARYMMFNNQIESGIIETPAEPGPVRSACGYTRLLHLGLLFTGRAPERMLVIGCGGGVGPQEFVRDYGAALKRIDVLDIDPQVFALARKYFRYPAEDPVIRSHVVDGRLFVERAKETWDYLVMDAYTSGGRIPRNLITREFFEAARDRLAPGGVMLANVITAIDPACRGSRLYRAAWKTLAAVFGEDAVYAFPRWRRGRVGENVLFVCAPGRPRLGSGEIQARYDALANDLLVQPGLRAPVANVQVLAPGRLEEVPILTDDFCPTDSMIPD